MSFAATCYWTMARSLLLALLAWPVCHLLERGLRASSRPTFWMILLASPFLLPELLAGYLLAPYVAGQPWRSEPACAALLYLRSVPIGVIALWGMPASSVSPMALHVRRLSLRTGRDYGELARCYWQGPIRRALPALGLMFLITFQEFEASALLGTVSWTDRLFLEHATGLSLAASGRFLIRPLAIQIAVLLLIGWSLWNRHPTIAANDITGDERPIKPAFGRCLHVTALGSFLFGVVCPLVLLAPGIVRGWDWLMQQTTLWSNLAKEMCTAGLVALVAGLAAWNLARAIVSSKLPQGLSALVGFPGLCGALTVSLAVLILAQRPLLIGLYDTPIPWVCALVVWLLPRAWLLQLWLARASSRPAEHLVEMIRNSPEPKQQQSGRDWRWRRQIEPQLAACGVLCYWAYLDVSSAGLLAPTGMPSVIVRLYNFMHFGRSAALSMEAALVMFLPAALWVLGMSLARFGQRGWSR